MGGGVEVSSSSVLICAPVTAHSVEQTVARMYSAKAQGADVIEVWLDNIPNFRPGQDLERILKRKPLPVIIVYRPKWEVGHCETEDDTRLETLLLACEFGANYIDLEFKVASGSNLIKELRKKNHTNCKIIVSFYVDGPTPSEEKLIHLVASMKATGADIIKLVSKADDITEMQRLFNLLSDSQIPLIAYSEGERGLISQILCPKFGGFLVYGSMKEHLIPGLPTLESLRETYMVKNINSDTKIFGLISKPVGHSKGPMLHNPTFRHVKYDGIYVPMFVDDLKEFFRVYSCSDYLGFSVGFPYKEAIVEFCDEVHPLAKSIGAVNTIIRRPSDGKLIGCNTDCEAAISAIEAALKDEPRNGKSSFISPLAGKQFVVVGAGGAGRAIAVGARSREARVIVFDIDFERARSLARTVSGEAQPFANLTRFVPEKGAILANATPMGMHPNTDRISVSKDALGKYRLVFDAVYTPRKTRLLKDAEAAGATAVGGVEMFLRQAIGQFSLFTGREAPKEFMGEIVEAYF